MQVMHRGGLARRCARSFHYALADGSAYASQRQPIYHARRRCAFGMDTHGARSRGPGRWDPRTGADAPQIDCSRRGLEMAVRDAGSTLPATLRLQRGQIRRPEMRLAPRIGIIRTPWGLLARTLQCRPSNGGLGRVDIGATSTAVAGHGSCDVRTLEHARSIVCVA